LAAADTSSRQSATSLPNLQTDGDTLKRVMIQLLESMMTITPAAGRVRVESQVRGNEMRIGVLSSGELPQNEIDDMFVGFIQGKHPEESYSSRLSMYLARNNVERLGGKIWAESEEGRGTAVYFILPVV
jgi:signal transduction histidine kinase